MGAESKIEWTTHTWNPWYGCPDDGKRSPACENCYARDWAKRFNTCDFDREIKRASDKTFYEPLNRKKYQSGDKVFVCSLSDFFHPEVPDAMMGDAWKVIQHERPDLTWMFLTKRPEKINTGKNFPSYESLTTNLWLGVTVENQTQADNRIPKLLEIPAAVHFVSVEPLLEPVIFNEHIGIAHRCSDCERVVGGDDECPNCQMDTMITKGIDWVICGGESGKRARPMHPAWSRKLRDDCSAAGVPFFFKQWGSRLTESAFDETHGICARMDLPKGGNLLDGRLWQEFPLLRNGS